MFSYKSLQVSKSRHSGCGEMISALGKAPLSFPNVCVFLQDHAPKYPYQDPNKSSPENNGIEHCFCRFMTGTPRSAFLGIARLPGGAHPGAEPTPAKVELVFK